MKKKAAFFIQFCILVGIFTAAGVLAAGEDKAPPKPALSEQAVESRLKNLTNLVNTSAGAARIEASGNEQALASHAAAKSALAEARSKFEAGDLEQADALLSKTTKSMFEAVRLVGTSKKPAK